ncbi:hypothetical protein [Sphingomonas sp.]|uniref:hypothetical protein n=1 Tax=unclassified Sphingomonas TaxID=196159 RepID=UPI0034261D17
MIVSRNCVRRARSGPSQLSSAADIAVQQGDQMQSDRPARAFIAIVRRVAALA